MLLPLWIDVAIAVIVASAAAAVVATRIHIITAGTDIAASLC